MSPVFTCELGHEWQASANGLPRCPVCGAPAQPLPRTLGAANRPIFADSEHDTIARPDESITLPAVERFAAFGYEILGELARGGMGVVYKARQPKLNRLVALKMILSGDHASPQEQERFRLEAEAVATLQHPQIVQLYEVNELDGRPFFTLEFVDGGNLAQRIAGAPQNPRSAAELIARLARAMHYAHQRGIVHRDLKPANVLLQADGTPKIIDFGLAKRLTHSGQTQTGAILGTPSYIAPEQAAGRAREVGPTVDIYALGAILYELLTGRPPFRGETAMDTMLQVMSEEPVPPTRLQPTVPRELETICLKCLRKEPHKRYGSAQELADDLDRYLNGEPIRARPIGWLGRGLKWARRRPAAAALVVVSGLAILSLLAGSLWYNARLQEQTRRADQQRAEAIHQKNVASEKEREALQQRELAQAQLENARRSLYALQLTQVAGVWQREPSRGLELLEDTSRCPHDLLDFTWTHLYRLCNRHNTTLNGHTKPVSALASYGDGLLATGSWDEAVILWKFPRVAAFASRGPGLTPVVLKGHAGIVLALAFAPDGKILASAGEDGTIRLWHVDNEKELFVLEEPGNWIKGVAFSPDGKSLASARSDGTIRIWDMDKRAVQTTFKGHQGPVTSVAFFPDGRMLASGGQDRSVRLWDVSAAKELVALTGHKDVVNAVAISSDGKTLASASGDGTVRLWDPLAHAQRLDPLEHGGTVYALAFAPDGKSLSSGGKDGVVKLWHTLSGEQRCVLRDSPGPVLSLAFTYSGRALATGSAAVDKNLKLWNIESSPGHTSRTIPAASGPCLVCDPGGNFLVATLDSRQVQIFPLRGNHPLLPLIFPVGGNHPLLTLQRDPLPATALAVTEKGDMLATGEVNGRITVWDRETGKEIREMQGRHGGPVRALVFLRPDTLASGGEDQAIRLWEVSSGKEKQTLAGHTGAITAMATAPHRPLLASASDDETILIWNLEISGQTPKPVTLRGHTLPVRCLTWASDGNSLASGSGNPHQPDIPGELRVWDIPSAKERMGTTGHAGAILSVAFAHRDRCLASAGEDRLVHLWDPVTGQERITLTGHSEGVHYLWFGQSFDSMVSVSRDGQVREWSARGPASLPFWQHPAAVSGLALADDDETLASVSRDGTIKLGHVVTGQERLSLKGHSQPITSVAFAPAGKILVTASLDGTAKLWELDLSRLQERAILQGHQGTVWAIAFSPNGQQIATAGEDGAIRLWDTTGRLQSTWHGHRDAVFAVAFAPDGQTLAAGDASGKVLLWDAATGQVRATLEMHTAAVRCLAFAPDGQALASGGLDRVVQLWEMPSGKRLETLRHHRFAVFSVAFSHDGRRVVSVGGDPLEALNRGGEALVWSRDGQQVNPVVHGHANSLTAVVLPKKRHWIVITGAADKVVRSSRY